LAQWLCIKLATLTCFRFSFCYRFNQISLRVCRVDGQTISNPVILAHEFCFYDTYAFKKNSYSIRADRVSYNTKQDVKPDHIYSNRERQADGRRFVCLIQEEIWVG
jgi:hypothetical protein